MMRKIPIVQKGQRICNKCGKIIINLPESFENKAIFSSISEYNTNEKEG
jgi:hypothetical protein